MKLVSASQDECAERRRGGLLTEPVVFFSRCKPQGADALTVALDASRNYIGYSMPRVGADYQPRNLSACVVDPLCSDEEWEPARPRAAAGHPPAIQSKPKLDQRNSARIHRDDPAARSRGNLLRKDRLRV